MSDGEEVTVRSVTVTGATGEVGPRGRTGATGEAGPAGAPPKMSEEQERRVDAMIRRQDATMSFVRNTGILVVGLLVIAALVTAAVLGRLGAIREAQDQGKVRTAHTQALSCLDLLRDVGLRLPSDCTTESVLPILCAQARETDTTGRWVDRIQTQTGRACSAPG